MAAPVSRSQMWFMDQGGGWFESEAIWRNLAVLREAYAEVIAQPAPAAAEVAVIVDEASLGQVAYGIELGLPLLYDIRAEFNRMGAPHELWLQADYLRGRGAPKKLVVFLNAFSLTAGEIRAIRARLADEGSTALWFYAPGILDPAPVRSGSGYDPARIGQLTGIRVEEMQAARSPAIRCRTGHRLTAGMAPDAVFAPDDIARNWQARDEKYQFRQMTYPPRERLYPLFQVAADQADVFGEFVDGGAPAMALKCMDGFTSVFVGGLTLPARLLANIAAEAGVHRYIESGDVIRTDGRFLGITACTPGHKTVHLPAPCEVADLFGGEIVCRGSAFGVDLHAGETRVYRIQ